MKTNRKSTSAELALAGDSAEVEVSAPARRRLRFSKPVVLLGFAMVLGCAKAPHEEVDSARQALERARIAGAADYAPEAMQHAQDAVAQLDTELQVQEERFALFRSYKSASQLAMDARDAGEKAIVEANQSKERSRGEAEVLISEARAALGEAKTLLATAPAGKGTQKDVEALGSDLTGVETTLSEAERDYQEGRFLEAATKAEAAKDAATKVKTDVESAKAAKGRM